MVGLTLVYYSEKIKVLWSLQRARRAVLFIGENLSPVYVLICVCTFLETAQSDAWSLRSATSILPTIVPLTLPG